MRGKRQVRLVLCALLTAGCASTGGDPAGGRHQTLAPPGSTGVSGAELIRYSHAPSLFDALRDVRPNMLKGRGETPLIVKVDYGPPTDVTALSLIDVSQIAEVWLVRATKSAQVPTAIRPNGSMVVGDVLYVLTKAGAARASVPRAGV